MGYGHNESMEISIPSSIWSSMNSLWSSFPYLLYGLPLWFFLEISIPSLWSSKSVYGNTTMVNTGVCEFLLRILETLQNLLKIAIFNSD